MPKPPPARSQMLLPMLETLRELGGRARPDEVITALTERFEISPEVSEQKVVYTWPKWGSRVRRPWRQTLHWVRQDAVSRGLIGRTARGIWTLTERGERSLANCQPGTILLVYETPTGEVIWADAITAAGAIADDSLDLIYQSPPYPILNGRAYGRVTEAEIIELIMKCAPHWRRGLKDSGSLVLNFKDCWLPPRFKGDGPERSLYIDKLVCALVEDAQLHFADRHLWRNPSLAPCTPFVTVQKVRCGNDFEHMLWFSKTRNPHADATAVMQPAKPGTMAAYLAKARRGQANKVCASGHNNVFEEQLAKALRGESIQVLPRTVQEFANSAPQVKWKRLLDEAGLPAHPARMPLALAKFWVRFLTKPGMTVADFFHGSGTTLLACDELAREEAPRHFVGSDRSLAYLLGSALRLPPERVAFGPAAT